MSKPASVSPAVKALAYIGFETGNTKGWGGLLTEVFGLEVRTDNPAGCQQYRLDDRHHRISIYAGTQERTRYIGWEMASREEVAALEAHLKAHGVAVERGSKALATERGVLELVCFENPDGIAHEACFGVGIDDKPFRPARPLAGFLTSDMGIGHVALMTSNHFATATWYRKMLGFRMSDVVEAGFLQSSFLHCNGRHHSLGLIDAVPGVFSAGTVNHLMLEALTIDDVGRGYDIAQARGYPLALTLGQHANDQMTSFYAYSPSAVGIEYGYGGLIVDDSIWQEKYFNTGDWWGHKLQPPPAAWPVKDIA